MSIHQGKSSVKHFKKLYSCLLNDLTKQFYSFLVFYHEFNLIMTLQGRNVLPPKNTKNNSVLTVYNY